MITSIIRWSIGNRFLVLLLSVLLHIPADHEHQFRFNVNTISGPM